MVPQTPRLYVPRSLDDLVADTLEALAGKPMVFLLGAGASAAAPSYLPQPRLIQEAVYRCVAPLGAPAEHCDLIVGSLPEIYHETLLELGGESTREIWKVLSLWELPEEAPSLAEFELSPNLVHHLVVYLSWKSRRPVVTVNFDNMLERAAANLGLRPDPRLGAQPGDDTVAIWKLHGTVERRDSIRTTLQGITAADPTVLDRVQREFASATGCLIGYSGRDIDFFPFLCGWREAHPIRWLSLDLEKTAINRFPDAFLGVDARAEEWARRVIVQLPESESAACRLKAKLDRKPPEETRVREAYRALLDEHAERVYSRTFPPDDAKRLLAHAMTLAALGRNEEADRWADQYLAEPGVPALTCRALLLKSAMAHEFARYADSREHAERALSLARASGLRPEAEEALLRVDEARRMMFLPTRLPFAKASDLLDHKSLSATASMVWHAIRVWHRIPRKAQGEVAPPYPELRASFESIEHLVRVGALLQGLMERLLPTLSAHRLLDRFWFRVERYSYSNGYALGIGNAKKYLLRRSSGSASSDGYFFSVLDLYQLVPSPTGTCIHHRDVADALLVESRKIPPWPARDAKRDLACCLYEKALDAACDAGDPSLQLKVMLGLKETDSSRSWSAAEVKGLIAAVQSPAFTKYGDQLLARLTYS
ncbi:MAG TPA: SIR2 family protein [Solirubrobacterales bacterium]|jgi:hypothetical protein|nr:SIR2 family protein [Solirubrobacterales bacterium]